VREVSRFGHMRTSFFVLIMAIIESKEFHTIGLQER
jgi:hypothetical protein